MKLPIPKHRKLIDIKKIDRFAKAFEEPTVNTHMVLDHIHALGKRIVALEKKVGLKGMV